MEKSRGILRGTKDAWTLIWNRLLPEGNGGSVLDAGCGEHVWEAKGWNVRRCDNWEEYKEQERIISEDVDKVDLGKGWPYEDNEFQGVIAADVIEHLENIWHFFREATRVSRDFVIITTPNTRSDVSMVLFEKYGRFWSFTRNAVDFVNHINPVFLWQLELAAKKAGWCIDGVEYVNSEYYHILECPLSRDIIDKQPGKRQIIVRMVSKEFIARNRND